MKQRMTNGQFQTLLKVIQEYHLVESQLEQIIALSSEKLRKERKPRGVGIKLQEGTANDLDFEIMCGESQKHCCEKYKISKTTFKRHRKKLIEKGLMPPINESDYAARQKELEKERQLEQDALKRLEDIAKIPNKKCEWTQKNGLIFAERKDRRN